MESLNPKRSLVEEANISLFRRRNKIIILVFFFLIISSALIISALIVELLRIHNTSTEYYIGLLKSPIGSFCSVSDSQNACLHSFNRILNNTIVLDPDQIFTISLETSVFEIQNLINSSSIASDSACSHSLSHALGQLGRPLAAMRVDPFVSLLSNNQRDEIRERIIEAGEDVRSCIVDQMAAEKLGEVEVYLNGGRDFLSRYDLVLRDWGTDFVVSSSFQTSLIYDNLFEIVMCGLQVLFMFGMFCALFRIR